MLTKSVFLTLFLSILAPSVFASVEFSVEGGSHAGNGGGTIVCRKRDGGVRTIQLLDYFEARELRGLDLDIGKINGNWKVKAGYVIERMRPLSALRAELYRSWLESFLSESKMLTGIVFSTVPDSMQIGVPAGCTYEQAIIQILPRFPGDRRYYINSELWNALDDNERAGLVLHEIVYREALSYGQTDSVATRYFVGVLSSSGFAKLSLENFFSLIVNVRFEQTDIPAMGVDVHFDPKRLWRVNESEETQIPSIFLKDRMVVDVGTCTDLGCTNYVRQTVGAGEGSSKLVCSGTTEFYVLGEEIRVNSGLSDPKQSDSKCAQWIEVSGSDDALEFQAEKKTLGSTQNMPVLHFRDHQASELMFELRNSKATLSALVSDYYTDDRLRAWSRDTNSSESSCNILLKFDQNRRVSDVSFAGKNEELERCITSFRVLKAEYSYDVVMTGAQSQFEFDPAGELITDVKRTRISVKDSVSSALFDCRDGDRAVDCLTIESKDVGGYPTMIRAEKFGEYYFPYFMKGGEVADRSGHCKIQDGVYPLYPNSLVPLEIVLREGCRLMTTAQTAAEFAAGSRVQLSADGYVMK
jgi:hypothetical protein